MKHITSTEEYYTAITTEPYCIIIYSLIKSCHPCRLLQEWLKTNYPDQDGIYYVDVSLPNIDLLTHNICALPTIELNFYTEVINRIEGFQVPQIKQMIDTMISKRSIIKSAPTFSLLDELLHVEQPVNSNTNTDEAEADTNPAEHKKTDIEHK